MLRGWDFTNSISPLLGGFLLGLSKEILEGEEGRGEGEVLFSSVCPSPHHDLSSGFAAAGFSLRIP